MIDEALRVCDSEEYSWFQSFDDALDELTRKLYEGKYYITPNSSIRILYNLDFHRFQTIASSSIASSQYCDAYTRTDAENGKARYPSTTLTIVEIKTNQNEFDDYIENIINKHTYTLEDLTKASPLANAIAQIPGFTTSGHPTGLAISNLGIPLTSEAKGPNLE